MQFVKRSFVCAVVVGVAFSAASFAQSVDYNENLKQTLKDENAPSTPAKKIVHKKIKRVADTKKSRKALPAKTTKIAQTTDPTVGTTAVRVKEVAAAEEVQESDAKNVAQTAPAPAPAPVPVPQQQPYQPIFILQPMQAPNAVAAPAPTAAPVVANAQVQPTTNVDSTAVPEPKSEALRKQREEMEHQTENKLIEKLEDDRLKSEKERAERLFAQPTPAPSAAPVSDNTPSAVPGVVAVVAPSAGPAPAPSAEPVKADANLAQVPGTVPQTAAPAPAPAPAPSVAPAPVVAAEGENTIKKEDLGNKDEEKEKRFSIGADAGLPNYPSANNITSYFSVGAMAHYKLENRFSVQGGFDYSKFDIKNFNYCPFCFGGTLVKGLNQYDVTLGLNYNILPGQISPVVGVVLDYARRNYYDKVDFGYVYGTPTGSSAFNAGLMAGADLALSKSLILGFQFKYLWNISYWTDDPLAYGLYGPIYGSAVESLGYYLATLNLRFLF